MIASEIRFWLMRQPRPAMVRVLCGTERTTVPVAAGQSWANVAQTIEALAPDLLEALDTNGNTIRATRGDDDGDEAELGRGSTASAPVAPPPAVPIQQLIIDPETARFELFARLLVEVTKHATEQARAGNEVAFAKLVDIANIMGKRGEALEASLAATERMLHKAWEERVEAEVDAAETRAEASAANPLGEIMSAFTGGQERAGAKAAPNGKAD